MQKGKALATCERLTLAKAVQGCSIQPAPRSSARIPTPQDSNRHAFRALHFCILQSTFCIFHTPHEASSSLGVNWGSYFVSVATGQSALRSREQNVLVRGANHDYQPPRIPTPTLAIKTAARRVGVLVRGHVLDLLELRHPCRGPGRASTGDNE